MSGKHRQKVESDEVTFGDVYGAELAVKVVMEIWQRLGVTVDGGNIHGFFETAESFLKNWPDAGDEALEIELKPHFDLVLGEGENPRAFSRLMAARLIRLMVQEFERLINEEARAAVEGQEVAPVVVEADEVNYLADDG